MRPIAVHGWREGDKYFTSLQPRAANGPKNTHDSAQEALREASKRGLPIVWDDPAVIG